MVGLQGSGGVVEGVVDNLFNLVCVQVYVWFKFCYFGGLMDELLKLSVMSWNVVRRSEVYFMMG